MAAHRAAHELRDAYREESGALPGRDGYPDGEAAPVLASPGWRRRQAEGALLSLADKAIEAELTPGRVRGQVRKGAFSWQALESQCVSHSFFRGSRTA